MKIFRKLNLKIAIPVMILFFIMVLFFVFNEYGLIRFYKLKSEIEELKIEKEKTDTLIVRKDREIDSLQTNNVKIEKVAREEHRMHKPNEEVIRISEE